MITSQVLIQVNIGEDSLDVSIVQVAHDGSISPLLGLLQIDVMVWPGMGSEVVFELYKNACDQQYYIRVLWSGQPMKTSTPLGTLDMIKIEDFFSCKYLCSLSIYHVSRAAFFES